MQMISYLHVAEQFGTHIQVPLFQSNSHRKKSTPGDLGTSLPLVTPLRQLALMEDMCCRDISPGDGIVSSRHIKNRMGERTSGGEGEATRQDGANLTEEHGERMSLF